MKRIIAWLALAGTLASPSLAQSPAPATLARPAFQEVMASPAHLEQLRQGGFVLYMRHGNTDNSRPDRYPDVDLNDCTTQRPLNDEGRQLMRDVGKAIRTARLPIAEIIASPMCRTVESARLAFGERFKTNEALRYSANMTSEEKKPRLVALADILRMPLPAGSNRLLVAHAPNLDDLIGFFVKPEGTVVIFAQRGALGYEYVASIPPAAWQKLNR